MTIIDICAIIDVAINALQLLVSLVSNIKKK